jgi:pilus assembly protein FimV
MSLISQHTSAFIDPLRPLPRSLGHAGPLLNRVAVAVALCAGLSHMSLAQAVVLGRMVVQSTQGQPLQAEIDVPEITPEEASSLQVRMASDEAFRAAGLAFNPTLSQSQISLQRRSDGGAFLRLTTSQAVSTPFVDVIVEAQWASGRLVRAYTLLLSPPIQATEAAPAPVPASAVLAAPTTEPNKAQVRYLEVKPGDTASQLAAIHRPRTVSLDQMLLAMLRSNPQAFVSNNVNRMKAGTVLDMPNEAEAQAIDPTEARQAIAAQSADFNAFRRRLADQVPTASTVPNERQSTGEVQAEVQEQASTAAAPDRLTLSKGSVAAGTEEETIAQQQQAREMTERANELARNLEDLAKIQAATPPTDTGNTTAGNETDASPAAATAALPTPVAAPTPEATPPLVRTLIDSQYTLPAVGGLLALLICTGWLVSRRRSSSQREDSSLTESQFQPDSFFDADSTLQANTPIASSLSATPAQTAGDVDPVAESDVYLAYGRDVQAEEILKEAQARDPSRIEIHHKLLSIYARRRDTQSFASLALNAHALTGGHGAQWEQICELGRDLDPLNPLYAAGGLQTQADMPADNTASSSTLASSLEMDLGATGHSTTGNTSTETHAGNPAVDFDFNPPPEMTARVDSASPASVDELTADFEFDPDEDMAQPRASAVASVANESLKIDWDALNLDIDTPPAEHKPSSETKSV